MNDILFTPTTLGSIELKNRIVMAPMTRSRAGTGDAPTSMNAEYYAQRAGAGMIITEGVQPSPNGKGYCRTPGIYNQAQIEGWKNVIDSVAAENGNAVMQIMHCGRVACHFNKEPGSETIAPSAVKAHGQIYTDANGMTDFDTPRALDIEEIPKVIEEYRQATANAFKAGFAGVELHGTSGYLPAQFLSTGTNKRQDKYGGSVKNRIRFVMETLEAMIAVNGADRVGMRICPGNPFNDLQDDDPEETFRVLLDAVNSLDLAYLHVIRMPKGPVDNLALAKQVFRGNLMFNDSYTASEAAQVLEDDQVKAISFARHYVANPDLVEKFRTGADLSMFDVKTLYTAGAAGYTDY